MNLCLKCIYGNKDLHTMLMIHLLKTEKEQKKLKKHEIRDIFIKTNQIKLVFNMIWFMEIL